MSEPEAEPQPFAQKPAEPTTRTNETASQGEHPSPDSAPFGRRLLALLVDGVLSVLAAGLFAEPQLWSSLILIAEYTFFTGLFGETPGMRLLGLRCVRLADGRPLGLPRALLRAVLLSLVLPAAVMDQHGRGYHDRAARSIVVRAASSSASSAS